MVLGEIGAVKPVIVRAAPVGSVPASTLLVGPLEPAAAGCRIYSPRLLCSSSGVTQPMASLQAHGVGVHPDAFDLGREDWQGR